MEAPLGSLTVSRPAHRAVASGLLSCIVLLSFCQLPRLHSGFNPDLNFGLEVVTMATCNMPAPPLLLFYSSVFPTSGPRSRKVIGLDNFCIPGHPDAHACFCQQCWTGGGAVAALGNVTLRIGCGRTDSPKHTYGEKRVTLDLANGQSRQQAHAVQGLRRGTGCWLYVLSCPQTPPCHRPATQQLIAPPIFSYLSCVFT